jgi:hypothetical protein
LHTRGTPAYIRNTELLGHRLGRSFDLVMAVTGYMAHARIATGPMPRFGVVHAVEADHKTLWGAMKAIVDDKKRWRRHFQSIPLIITDLTEHRTLRKIPSKLPTARRAPINGMFTR